MEIRGKRECRDCGERWSYFETGAVTCPACGSIRSVGVDERTHHTDAPASLDLTEAQTAAAEDDLYTATTVASSTCREYVRSRGFLDGGQLLPLDEVFVAAQELRHVAGAIDRALDPSPDDRAYYLALLRGAPEGDRPPATTVTPRLRSARGLAAASAVDAYLRDLAMWRRANDDPQNFTTTLGRLRDHVRRIEALDGDVEPQEADRLVRAAQALGRYVIEESAEDLAAARAALEGLA